MYYLFLDPSYDLYQMMLEVQALPSVGKDAGPQRQPYSFQSRGVYI